MADITDKFKKNHLTLNREGENNIKTEAGGCRVSSRKNPLRKESRPATSRCSDIKKRKKAPTGRGGHATESRPFNEKPAGGPGNDRKKKSKRRGKTSMGKRGRR